MIVFKADHTRTVNIPGVPNPVKRPVDIDPSMTGFTRLRTLRIYEFDAGAVIEGRAEGDEVFVVVLAGVVDFTTMSVPGVKSLDPVCLRAPDELDHVACAVYLPPHAAYHLAVQDDAVVAYARATPVSIRPPATFVTKAKMGLPGATVLLNEQSHAERLRFSLIQIDAQDQDVSLSPGNGIADDIEFLAFLKQGTASGEKMSVFQIIDASGDVNCQRLDSWDSVGFKNGTALTCKVTCGSTAVALIVSAI